MKPRDNKRRIGILIGLCLALTFSLGSGVVEAKKKDKASNKCEGTKKQRKQKMEKREITDEQFSTMVSQLKLVIAADRELMKQAAANRLSRKYEAHLATGEPFVYDMLLISGGGAKGAFGAGFFEGWGEIESGTFARPEFDVVTGVSTGALLAPFVFVGTDDAYSEAADFYANPEPNWVKKRGMIKFLPGHISMFNTCHLQDTVREAIDTPMLEALAKLADEDRLLLIGTTNLDVGVGHVFNLGEEAKQALEYPDNNRVAEILIASSSIPGAFPPIEIEGMLYADGGATSNLFIANFPGPDGPAARFKARYPDAPFPKVRVWVIVNQQLKPQHAITEPKWISVSGRALDTLTSTSQIFALGIIRDMVHQARTDKGIDAELHMVSIPNDAPKKTTAEMFDKEYMLKLSELGRKMGAVPSNWTTEIPSAYQVEGDWIGSE